MFLSRDHVPELADAFSSTAQGPLSSRLAAGRRLAEGFLHILAAMGLGVLAAGGVLVALIWFSMHLPNG